MTISASEKRSLLERKTAVGERVRFLRTVIEFALSVTSRFGAVLSRTFIGGPVLRELNDIDGFKFQTNTRQTDGLYAIAVSYLGNLVLDVSWGGVVFDECRCVVVRFEEDTAWQKDIMVVVARRESIFAQLEARLGNAPSLEEMEGRLHIP